MRLRQAESVSLFCYRLAGQRLWSDVPFPVLTPWSIGETVPRAIPWIKISSPAGEPRRMGPAWIGNRWREVRSWEEDEGRRVRFRIEAAGEWLVDLGRLAVHRLGPAPCDPDLAAEIALGPALILLLARLDIFCLHASGVLIDERACLLLGGSGRGKSTLARDPIACSLPDSWPSRWPGPHASSSARPCIGWDIAGASIGCRPYARRSWS